MNTQDSGSTAVRPTTTAGPGAQQDGELGAKGQHVAEAAKGQAADVAATAKEQAAAVAGTAQEQAQNVLGEAKEQAGDLFDDLRRQLAEQSDVVRDRLSDFLTGVGNELGDMAGAGGGSGYATQVVRQVGDRASSWGSQLQGQGSGELLQQTRAYARRKPGTFLLGAIVAGVVAGRLTRGAKAHHDQTPAVDEPAVRPETPAVAAPVTGTLYGLESSGVRPTEDLGR